MPRSSTGKIFNMLDGLRATIAVSVLGNNFLSKNTDDPSDNLKNALLAVAITETIVNLIAIIFALANLTDDSLLYVKRSVEKLPDFDSTKNLAKIEAGVDIADQNRQKANQTKNDVRKEAAQNTKNYSIRIGKSFSRILLALFGLTGSALLFSDLKAKNDYPIALIGIWFIAVSLTTSKSLSYFPTDNPDATLKDDHQNPTKKPQGLTH